MPTADVGFAFGLEPAAAIQYFERKGFAVGFDWTDVWEEAHAKAFTVAGVMRLDVLADIKGALTDSMRAGGTLADFQRQLQPVLERKGWWGKTPGQPADPDTGEVQHGKRLTPARLELIHRQNTQSSYSAGRYQALMENVADRPWFEYIAILDSRTRPAHRALSGRIFRYDDPFWGRFWPPNGWRCRCRVRARSDRDVARKGLVTSSSEGLLETIQQPINRAGETRPAPAFKLPDGTRFTADPGFGFNPGKESLAQLGQLLIDRAATAPTRVAALAVQEALGNQRVMQATKSQLSGMVQRVVDTKQARGELMHVGALSQPVLDGLEARGLPPVSSVISVRDEDVLHAMRDTKDAQLSPDFWSGLPESLRTPSAVLLDTSQAKHSLLYVVDADGDGKNKVVVVLDYELKVRDASGKKVRTVTNMVRTGKYLAERQLNGLLGYELLFGSI